MPVPVPRMNPPGRAAAPRAALAAVIHAADAAVHRQAHLRGRLDRAVFQRACEALHDRFPRLDPAAARACVSHAFLGAIARMPELFWHDGARPAPGAGRGRAAA